MITVLHSAVIIRSCTVTNSVTHHLNEYGAPSSMTRSANSCTPTLRVSLVTTGSFCVHLVISASKAAAWSILSACLSTVIKVSGSKAMHVNYTRESRQNKLHINRSLTCFKLGVHIIVSWAGTGASAIAAITQGIVARNNAG